jgi:hypothetical protein
LNQVLPVTWNRRYNTESIGKGKTRFNGERLDSDDECPVIGEDIQSNNIVRQTKASGAA